jgi:hypothetical protein
MNKNVIVSIIVILVLLIGGYFLFNGFDSIFKNTPTGNFEFTNKSQTFSKPTLIEIDGNENLDLEFNKKDYNSIEYTLPLEEMPINYDRDITGKFGMFLTEEQKNTLFNNGVVIVEGKDEDKFEKAYDSLNNKITYRNKTTGERELDESGVPIIVTSDSVLNLFHIEFNEILKNLEITKLNDLLNDFLSKSIDETYIQYNSLQDSNLQELSKRNLAYLSVAKKLLDPDYKVYPLVEEDVKQEISRIEDHKGFYKNELFSKDCPKVCSDRLYLESIDNKCNTQVKGEVTYKGEIWLFQDLYRDVCSKKCYCEDYSQYVPRGHYTSSEQLKNYFKSMMWLGRMTFKTNGENWTKQALLLSEAVKSADVDSEWNTIYSTTSFFAGVSEDLSFYDYDMAFNNIISDGSSKEEALLDSTTFLDIQNELKEMKGPKILNNFEFDLSGSLKEMTQGMRLLGQRYAIDSQILSDMVYRNVGPNPDSKDYNKIVSNLTEDPDFYKSCENMDTNRLKYWNEVCESAIIFYCPSRDCSLLEYDDPKLQELYNTCRFMPSGVDVISALGSNKADEIIDDLNYSSYCNYSSQLQSSKNLVDSYSTDDWTKNLYNSWLWILQPVIEDKEEGYPSWMKSEEWKKKDLITALGSWAQLRHDTILYVKQSYTSAGMIASSPGPIESKYYGFVEPNPKLYFRAGKTMELLRDGLEEKELLNNELKESINSSITMMNRLEEISNKELTNQALSEKDYDYIENISDKFDAILKQLASALTIREGTPGINKEKKERMASEDDPFNTQIIADVHTEANSQKVLEVGTGKIDWIIVAHKSKDGSIGLAVGPIFSYYEFPWAMKDRLTDQKWRAEVIEDIRKPEWLYN